MGRLSDATEMTLCRVVASSEGNGTARDQLQGDLDFMHLTFEVKVRRPDSLHVRFAANSAITRCSFGSYSRPDKLAVRFDRKAQNTSPKGA